ncbi:MAG: BREX-2 system adenine-specific DNA-methyltransferase PglX [Deltaproteobacteria bacterium]|nr:BREX-2 system adenine-specific DNA-methyltransferase PglX [Deltaproteobacteria bacterium]
MPVDARAVLSHLVPLLPPLTADLAQQAADPAAERTLRAEHAAELEARRTADPYTVWLGWRCQQLAAAWLLSGLFLRALEDRGLLPPRLRAVDARRATLRRLCPWLDDRAVLRVTLAEAAATKGFASVFDEAHNPIWTLWPSAAGATALLEGLADPAGLGGLDLSGDTRWLGDVYEELDKDARERFALRQTPDFVEVLLLDLALTPALRAATRVQEVTVIDPACGSGHLLVGSFWRLFRALQNENPDRPPLALAMAALEGVHGVDINPYAAAIAHFRLVLAVVDAGGVQRAEDLPEALDPKVGWGDGLRPTEGILGEQQGLPLIMAGQGKAKPAQPGWVPSSPAAQRAMGKGKTYRVVVGNPPYITAKDEAVSKLYRDTYPNSATGKYQLVAPFIERFFQLAGGGGHVAMIVGNGFMKREFGKSLIQVVLPKLNLTHVIDTSGAYIPGHGTPTVILAGTGEGPKLPVVRAVLGKRGEPSTPTDPSQGLVWRSIVDHLDDVGFDNDYVTVAALERESLKTHPWSLKGGGAGGLQERIEGAAERRLVDYPSSVGIASFTLEDDMYLAPRRALVDAGVPADHIRAMVIGEDIRDWATSDSEAVAFPYQTTLEPIADDRATGVLRYLWHGRTLLANNRMFGNKTKVGAGLRWFEFGRLNVPKLRSRLSITFAFVATHNHFVLDRGGKVFNRSAPIIKLPPEATEAEHLALVGYLNSSVACFWMKQAGYNKDRAIGDKRTEKMLPENSSYEFPGAAVERLPIPSADDRAALLDFSAELDALGARRAALKALPTTGWSTRVELEQALAAQEQERASILRRMVAIQEELDWAVYRLFGLTDAAAPALPTEGLEVDPDERPFEWATDDPPASLAPAAREVYAWRRRQRANDPHLGLLEQRVYKRLWLGTRGVFGHGALTWAEQVAAHAQSFLLDALEQTLKEDPTPQTPRTLARALRDDPKVQAVAALYAQQPEPDLRALFAALIEEEAVPLTAAQRYTDAGLVKHAAWRQTWAAQDAEDRGEAVTVPLPPKYGSGDFRKPAYWRARGKLDVPKERFVRLPVDADQGPLVLWAGHLAPERMAALAGRFDEAEDQAEQLALLVAMHELLPELLRWWGEDTRYTTPLRAIWPADLEARRRKLGLTVEALDAWRPSSARRGTGARAPSAAAPDGAQPAAPAEKLPKAPKPAKAPRAPAHTADELFTQAALGAPQTRAELAAALGWGEPEVGALAEELVAQGRWQLLKKRPLTYGAAG